MKKLLLTSLITFALLVVGYGAALAVLPDHMQRGTIGTTQWDRNIISLQTYLYEPAPEVVVVGSSLGTRLSELPAGWSNLALAGGSAMTGLETVRRASGSPRLVLVELNFIDRGVDEATLGGLFMPVAHQLRDTSPAFRHESRPSAVASRVMTDLYWRIEWRLNRALGGDGVTSESAKPQAARLTEARRASMVAEQLAKYEAPVDGAGVAGRVTELRQVIDQLAERGVAVALFEMPEDATLYDAPAKAAWRAALAEALPRDRYHWVDAVRWSDYHTTDGLHLAGEQAQRYTRHLVAAVGRLDASRSANNPINTQAAVTKPRR